MTLREKTDTDFEFEKSESFPKKTLWRWVAHGSRIIIRIALSESTIHTFFLGRERVTDTCVNFFKKSWCLVKKSFLFASITYLRHTKRVACSRKSSHSFFPEPCFQRFRRKKGIGPSSVKKRLGVHIIVGFMSI